VSARLASGSGAEARDRPPWIDFRVWLCPHAQFFQRPGWLVIIRSKLMRCVVCELDRLHILDSSRAKTRLIICVLPHRLKTFFGKKIAMGSSCYKASIYIS
jgi:hypothetical protein